MNKKKTNLRSDEDTISKLRSVFKNDPEMAHLSPYIRGGLNIVDYTFSVLESTQKVKAPQGIEIAGIEIRSKNPKSKKANGEVEVAGWVINIIEETLKTYKTTKKRKK